MSNHLQQSDESCLADKDSNPGVARKGFRYRPDGVCEAPNCTNPVAGGMVHHTVHHYSCSPHCKRKAYNARYAAGLQCEHCHGPILGNSDRSRTPRFCSAACSNLFRRERQMGGTGPYRDTIEDYLKRGAASHTESSRVQARIQLARFFTYVHSTEKLASLNLITPKVVTRFVAAERARGMTTPNPVTLVAAFFRWAQDEDLYDRRSPVIPRIHSGPIRTRQPYDDKQIETLRAIVEGSERTYLKLIFAIGEECGLRNSEVCNIRISDINLDQQTIFVRLPTKNKATRTVPYHNRVKKYLQEWLRERNPLFVHDNLIHTTTLRVPNNAILDYWFKHLLGKQPEPAASFEFHRLRHTWATRLVNGGMELPVLQELGGWRSLSSVQIYAKVRRSTIDLQYQAAISAIEEKQNSPEEQELSLVDFSLMNAPARATPSESGT